MKSLKLLSLKLFFTNTHYRRRTLEILKHKFFMLPGIKHIVALFHVCKRYKKMQNMTQWERYVAMKNAENNSEKIHFYATLARLKLVIAAEGSNIELFKLDKTFVLSNKELFEQAKSEILSNEIINEPSLKDFKEWVEKIDSNEKDYSRINEIINSFNPQ